MESFAPPSQGRTCPVSTSTPAMEGCGGRQHQLLLGSDDGRDVFISPVFIPPSLTVGYRVVSFCFVFLRGTKEERRAVSLLLCPLLLGPECLWGCYVLYPNRQEDKMRALEGSQPLCLCLVRNQCEKLCAL